MTPTQVVNDPRSLDLACETANARCMSVLYDLGGDGHGVVAMFVSFLAACKLAGEDAWLAFERLLALFEARQQATHRGSAASN